MLTKSSKKTAGRPAEIGQSQILDAAELLFSEQGYDGATTRALAKVASCNIAMISYYFGSKDGLYQAVLQRHFERSKKLLSSGNFTQAQLLKAWPQLKGYEEREFCASLFEFGKSILSHTPIHKIIQREMMSGGEKLVNALIKSDAGVYKPLSKKIEALKKSGHLQSELDIRFAAVSLLGPMIYSTTCGRVLKDVYGFSKLDELWMKSLCLHLTKSLFHGYGNTEQVLSK